MFDVNRILIDSEQYKEYYEHCYLEMPICLCSEFRCFHVNIACMISHFYFLTQKYV